MNIYIYIHIYIYLYITFSSIGSDQSARDAEGSDDRVPQNPYIGYRE